LLVYTFYDGQATRTGKLLQFSFEIVCFSAIGFYLHGSSIKMMLSSINIASFSIAAQTAGFTSTNTTTIR